MTTDQERAYLRALGLRLRLLRIASRLSQSELGEAAGVTPASPSPSASASPTSSTQTSPTERFSNSSAVSANPPTDLRTRPGPDPLGRVPSKGQN
jgi:hypothetical protein